MKRLFGPVWAMPILLALFTIAGLVGALVGDGWWDQLAALALGAPAAIGIWYSVRRPPERR